jgi:AcrR family transcriptional regulator
MRAASNSTHQTILDAAERLFAERGYAAVKMHDIARAVDMRHASLYYYAPAGKEQLYVEVMERNFNRHRAGLTDAIIRAGDDLRAQMHAVAEWFASQPPVDLGQIVRSDMPAISQPHADRLMELSLAALRQPIASALRRAQDKGLVNLLDVNFAAMGLVGFLQTAHNIPQRYYRSTQDRTQLATAMADMLLDGWLKR